MTLGDRAAGVLLLVLGLAVAIPALTFPPASGQPVGPGLFPFLVGCGIVSCGLLLLWLGWERRERPPVAPVNRVVEPRGWMNAAAVVGALVFYALAVEWMGFLLCASLILAVLLALFRVRRRWIAPIAVVVTLGLHVAFYTVLRVPLPWGWLEGMAW